MKKIIITIAFFISEVIFAQGTLHIFNYSPYAIDYTLVAQNIGNSTGNCLPSIESKPTNGILRLKPAIDPNNIPSEAYYSNVTTPLTYAYNLSNTYNSAYPDTPLIDKWTNGIVSYNVPSGILNIYGATTSWAFSKFQIVDVSVPGISTNLGGDSVGLNSCGGPASPVSGAYYYSEFFSMGGETWWITQ